MSDTPHLRNSSALSVWMTAVLWLAFMIFLLSFVPSRALNPTDAAFIAALGVVGLWRWSWGGFHMLRAYAYTRHVFPMIRTRAQTDVTVQRRHVAVVILSWKMGDAMNAAVYANLFRDILDNGGGGTVVAAVSSGQDEAMISHIHRRTDPLGQIRLAFTRQDGTGKRSAMADALARLRGLGVPPDCPGILMDGDTLVQPGLIRRTAPILLHQPNGTCQRL